MLKIDLQNQNIFDWKDEISSMVGSLKSSIPLSIISSSMDGPNVYKIYVIYKRVDGKLK